jgi:anthranilate phosphoribosyltransferase
MVGVMEQVMEGGATPAQIGALLIALRVKGETVEEITGAARVMRAKCTPVPCQSLLRGEPLVDTCGTGGDGAGTFNVSTVAAFVASGAGVKVAKHGNRSVSSRCGSADLVEALGVPLDMTPDQVGECIDQVGIGFLFAPALHGAMRHAIGPRREIGLRTIFNLLGPLTNPAGATAQVLGVYDPNLVEPLARVLRHLGTADAFVVHGQGGLDEISLSGPTLVARLQEGRVETFTLTPEEVGLARAGREEVKGGDAAMNARLALEVLEGKPGPRRDMALINAAAALVAAGKAGEMREGVGLAAQAIDSGAALARLDQLVALGRAAAARAAGA